MRIRFLIAFAFVILAAGRALAHCDSLNGPVVADARVALDSGKVDAVLKWVKPSDEPAVREAFAQTLAVRRQSDSARALADRWFFETVVRLHRSMEQEPFTGLRPPDWKPDPVIETADEAIATGQIDGLERMLLPNVRTGLLDRFERVRHAREHRNESVAAGRAYVAAYLDYLRYVESLQGVRD